jgi:hypothetical protein
MFGGEQELAAVAGWIGGEQQARASGLEQGRSGAGRVQGVGRRLAQGAGEQDSAVGLAGELDEGRQAAGETGDGTGRVDDDQAGIEGADDSGQVVEILGERVGAGVGQGT